MLVEPLPIILLVIEAFEKLNVTYLIGGSLAPALHGTARSTLDTVLVADLRPEKVNRLVEMLRPGITPSCISRVHVIYFYT